MGSVGGLGQARVSGSGSSRDSGRQWVTTVKSIAVKSLKSSRRKTMTTTTTTSTKTQATCAVGVVKKKKARSWIAEARALCDIIPTPVGCTAAATTLYLIIQLRALFERPSWFTCVCVCVCAPTILWPFHNFMFLVLCVFDKNAPRTPFPLGNPHAMRSLSALLPSRSRTEWKSAAISCFWATQQHVKRWRQITKLCQYAQQCSMLTLIPSRANSQAVLPQPNSNNNPHSATHTFAS